MRWKRHGDSLAGRTEDGLAEKFLLEVVLPYQGDECLIWPFWKTIQGYGMINFEHKDSVVSRLVCEKTYGAPPTPKYQSAHSCGHGADGCVSPKHMRWATRAENEADKLKHGTHNRGERQGKSRLKEANIREIRALKGALSQTKIAERFGITQSHVAHIYRGKVWGWLKG